MRMPAPNRFLMLILPSLLAACSEGGSASATPPTVVAAPAGLGMCVACHGQNGISPLLAHPHLAGQDAAYLKSALRQYRSGERSSAAMRAAIGSLGEAELDDLADYFAALPRAGDGASRQP